MKRIRSIASAVATLAIAVTLLGCSQGNPQHPYVQTGALPNEDVVGLAEHDLAPTLERALDQLPEIVNGALESSGVPGAAVAVVHDGATIYEAGFGLREAGESATIDENTVFQIASLSKPLSATVIAKAVTDGIVTWDTPVASLLPEFALSDDYVTRNATIGDYFSHRTGLHTGAGDDLEDIGYDRATILQRLRLQPLDAFRSSYHYSNFGITVGAESVARAAGTSWEELAENTLFEPLGMTSTSARYEDFLSRENRATIHTKVDGVFIPEAERDPDPQAPAGGVSSNVVDLAAWMKMVLAGGQIDGHEHIAASALLAATSAHSISGTITNPSQRPMHYGYGFNVGSQPGGRVMLGHSGAFVLGAATTFQLIPDLDLGIVVLTNAGPIGLPEGIAAEFLDIVQFGQPTRDWIADYGAMMSVYYEPVGDLAVEEPPRGATDRPLEAYEGVYRNAYFGDLTVSLEPSGLVATLGPDSAYRLPLEAWSDDVFAFAPTGENAPAGSLSSARFTLEDGRAASVTLEFFDAQGLGTWTRDSHLVGAQS